ncbi:MAG: hypothetical protein ACXVCP_03285 [Bdellovibrio sp.]
MILKDNDCGVDVDRRTNNMRVINAIEQVRHISPNTYRQIMRLQQMADASDSQLKSFFKNTLLYREKDFARTSRKSFLDNLNRVATVLKENCQTGALSLDLDPRFNSSGELLNTGISSCSME